MSYIKPLLLHHVPRDIRQLIRDAAESHALTGPDTDYLTDPRTDQAYAESLMITSWLDAIEDEERRCEQ